MNLRACLLEDSDLVNFICPTFFDTLLFVAAEVNDCIFICPKKKPWVLLSFIRIAAELK